MNKLGDDTVIIDGKWLVISVNVMERGLSIESFHSLAFAKTHLKERHTFTSKHMHTVYTRQSCYAITYDDTLNPVVISRIVPIDLPQNGVQRFYP